MKEINASFFDVLGHADAAGYGRPRPHFYVEDFLLMEEGAGEETGGGDGKTFTQDEVNSLLAKERKKQETAHRSALQKELKEKEDLLSEKNLSDKRRSELEARAEELRTQLMDAEQKKESEINSLKKQYETKLGEQTEQTNRFRTLFQQNIAQTAIMQEAANAKAYNPSQVMALIQPMTEVVEVKNEKGESTGQYAPRVTRPVKQEDGSFKNETMTVSEAIKSIKEEGTHANLFQDTSTGGTGQRGGPGGGKDLSPDDYLNRAIESGEIG